MLKSLLNKKLYLEIAVNFSELNKSNTIFLASIYFLNAEKCAWDIRRMTYSPRPDTFHPVPG